MKLFFGSTNPGKLRELRRMVSGLQVEVVGPEDLGWPLPEVVEDGATFRENAEKKASAFARVAGLHAVADDSGLCVDALGGAPGVHSARWSEMGGGASLASPACTLPEVAARELGVELSRAARDEANNDKLLRSLESVGEGGRGGAYVAVLALARPDGSIATAVEGTCRGSVAQTRRGSGGFGYDPLFLPDGVTPARTMAELEPAEKDRLSHRGAAFRALRPALERLAFDKARDEG